MSSLFISRHPIPYYSRSFISQMEWIYKEQAISNTVVKLNPLLSRLTGGYSYKDCGSKCLVTVPSGMLNPRIVKRSQWYWLTRNVEGNYLQPVNVQVEVDLQVKCNIYVEKWEKTRHFSATVNKHVSDQQTSVERHPCCTAYVLLNL